MVAHAAHGTRPLPGSAQRQEIGPEPSALSRRERSRGLGSYRRRSVTRASSRVAAAQRVPKVGFVSLGCPKALVDSERILTQLRAEGYEVAPSYESADVVVVNTCGFIDAAIDESLDAIGEALEQNGRVIVTGCLEIGRAAGRE